MHGVTKKTLRQVGMIPGRDNQAMSNAPPLNFNLSVTLNQAHGPLGIIRAQGADTVKFLQGQLTQDVALLGLSEARLAAWCSAKGRMLASFIVFKNTHEDILLLCSPSVLPATLKRLQMFVMRAQCKLSDATAEFVVQGLLQAAAPSVVPSDASTFLAARATSTMVLSRNDAEITVQLPPGLVQGQRITRSLRVAPVAPDAAPVAEASSEELALWQYVEVSCGIAPITAPISEAFVPQMLNYESIGGVNFKKGCYPGQEVVARSQFRGTLKRRGYIISSAAPLAAGQELFDSRDTEQPCGTVAYAAQQPGDGDGRPWLAIASMQTSAADSPGLLASAQGPAVQLQALPYVLLDDI
jgi:tRNA-modifying protein YgfZ